MTWIHWKKRLPIAWRKMKTITSTRTWREQGLLAFFRYHKKLFKFISFAENLVQLLNPQIKEFQSSKSLMLNEEIKLKVLQTITLQVFWERMRRIQSWSWHGMEIDKFRTAKGKIFCNFVEVSLISVFFSFRDFHDRHPNHNNRHHHRFQNNQPRFAFAAAPVHHTFESSGPVSKWYPQSNFNLYQTKSSFEAWELLSRSKWSSRKDFLRIFPDISDLLVNVC